MQNIEMFIQSASKYPAIYMDFKNEKEERAVVKVLEELYKLTGWNPDKGNPNTIANAVAIYREFTIANKMLSKYPVKEEYLSKVVDSLEESCKIALNEIQRVCKTHPKTNEYFKHTFTMKPSDFKQECGAWKHKYLGETK